MEEGEISCLHLRSYECIKTNGHEKQDLIESTKDDPHNWTQSYEKLLRLNIDQINLKFFAGMLL